ncbi:MAG: T9SS type A sorting domain-containing protein [Crocinitomicaceae bacterium]|nr:T9SS type A sorting domain-containing protein [Crocinitomicaceae bacterium]
MLIPNPASDNFTISFDSENEKSFTLLIINPTGEIVYRQEILAEEKVITRQIDAAEFPAGVYTVQIIGATIRKSRLVIY